MQTHNIYRRTANNTKKQVGRGGTRGKTSGRGTKGQKARAGHKLRPEIRDFIKSIPKLRGRGKNSNTSIQKSSIPVSLASLNQRYSNGEEVSKKTLMEKGIISRKTPSTASVKILATGELDKKLTISGCKLSATAKEKIEALGGIVKE